MFSKPIIKESWNKSTFVDLFNFIFQMRSQNKGVVHRHIVQLEKLYSGNWIDTIMYNNVSEIRKYVELCKNLGIKSELSINLKDLRKLKFSRQSAFDLKQLRQILEQDEYQETQMFSGMSELKKTATEMCTNVNKTFGTLNKVVTDDNMTKLQGFIDSVSGVADTITDAMKGMCPDEDNGVLLKIITLFMKFIAFGYLLSEKQNRTAGGIAALITLILPVGIGKSIITILSRAVKGIMSKFYGDVKPEQPMPERVDNPNYSEEFMETQANGDDECYNFMAQSGDNNEENLVSAFFSMFKHILVGSFKGVNADMFKQMQIAGNKVKMIADYIRASTTIIDTICRLTEKIISLFGDLSLKHFGIIPWFLKEDRLTPLVDEYIQMKILKRDVKAKTNDVAAKQVVTLYEKIIKFQGDVVKNLGKGVSYEKTKIMPYLNVMVKNLEDIVSQIPDHLRGTKNARRTKPFWIYIFGDPRVGKTATFQPYVVNYLARYCEIIDKYEDYANYTYFRNCGEEYWEKYAGQPFLWYNDLFQTFGEEMSVNTGIMELTNVVDDNLYALNMAFNEKHSIYMNSQIVVSNAQMDIHGQSFIANKCLSGGQHLYSRRNVVIRFRLNKDYGDAVVGINYQLMNERMRTVPCVGDLFPRDMYILDFMCPHTGQYLYSRDFERGIREIAMMANLYREHQGKFKEKLYKHFETFWAQAKDDEFYDAQQEGWRNVTPTMKDIKCDKCLKYYVEQVNAQKLDEKQLHALRVKLFNHVECMEIRCAECRKFFAEIQTCGIPPYDLEQMRERLVKHQTCVVVKTVVGLNPYEDFKRNITDEYYKVKQMCQQTVEKHPILKVLWTFTMSFVISFAIKSVVELLADKIVRKTTDMPSMHTWYEHRMLNMMHGKEVGDAYKASVQQKYSQSSEGNLKAPIRSIVRVKNSERNKVVAQSYDQQNVDIEAKIRKHMCKITYTMEHEGKLYEIPYIGNALCVGSDIFVMPKHYWSRFVEMHRYYETKKVNMTMKISWTPQTSVTVDYSNMTAIDLDYAHTQDLIYVRMKDVCHMSNLSKFFSKAGDTPSLFETYLYGYRHDFTVSTISVHRPELRAQNYMMKKNVDPIFGEEFDVKHIYIPVTYTYYDCYTVGGDCGLVYMNTDSRMNARKCMGIHTAGNVSAGSASPIFQEDIEEAIAALDPAPIFMEAHSLQPVDSITSTIKNQVEKMFVLDGCAGTYIKNGKEKKIKMTMPSKTKINKSIFHDVMNEDFGMTNLAPAQLRPKIVNGEKVSPLLLGLAKMVPGTKGFSKKYTDNAVDHIQDSLMSWQSKYSHNPRILSDDEMINGFEDLRPIDMRTSPGYPYILDDNSNGKNPWFNKQENKYTMKDNLVQDVRLREKMASKGLIKPTIFIDTLKDETRPIEKVEQCKTRVFQVGPMDLSLLTRKYFGYFIAHCQTTYIDGEMGVGINPHSQDWGMLLKRLQLVGNKFLCGDYSNYDGVMSQPAMMRALDAINNWYSNSEFHEAIHDIIRKVLFATIFNNVHMVEDMVFTRTQSNMSGVAVTTLLNNIFNMFLLRIAYMHLVDEDLTNFNRHLSSTFYGDDNLVSVHPDIQHIFTMGNYCKVMARYGITYTSANKKDIPMDLLDLEDITYLKRQFLVREHNICFAPMKVSDILEIPRWSESDPYNMVDQMNRFNASLMELSHHGEKYVIDIRKVFVGYLSLCASTYAIDLNNLMRFDYIRKMMYPEIYSIHCRDLALKFDTFEVVRDDGGCGSFNLSTQFINSGQLNCDISTSNNDDYAQSHEGTLQKPSKQIQRIKMHAQSSDQDQMFIDHCRERIAMGNSFNHLTPQYFEQGNKFFNVQSCPNCKEKYPELEETDNIVNAKDFSKMFAQSNVKEVNNLQIIDENAGETVTRSEICTTFDDTVPHIAETNDIPTPLETNPYQELSLEAFINREWYLANLVWKSDTPRTALVKAFDLPYVFNDYLKSKVQNIAMWAPDIELTFKINGTPMHYGRIMFGVVPQAFSLNEAYLQPQNFSQHKVIQISPTGNQSVRLKVPWTHFLDRVSLADTGDNCRKVWTLYYWVAVPLQSANSATPSPVDITVYGRVTNPRFVGYTHMVAQSTMYAQSSEQNTLSVRENTTAPTTSVGRVLYDAAKMATNVGTVISDMSQVATTIGMGVTPNLTAAKPVFMRQTLLTKVEDLPGTIVLGPSQAALLDTSENYANGTKDDHRLGKIAGRMSLYKTIKIDSTTVTNTEIVAIPLTPGFIKYTDYSLATPANCCFPLPMCYLAKYAQLWRGSFRFHFSFISSAFHSMRLRLAYVPPTNTTTGPNSGSAAFDVNEIWDINNQTDYSFTVPFLQYQDWLGTNDVRNSGSIFLIAMTGLSSVMGTPNPIYLQIWMSMCDDFQLAYPDIKSLTTTTGALNGIGNPDCVPWVVKTDKLNEDTRIKDIATDDFMVAQMADPLKDGNPLLNYKSGQFPAMSIHAMMNMKYPVLGGKGQFYKSYRINTSYEISSIKELMNMLTCIEKRDIAATADSGKDVTYATAGRAFVPFGVIDRNAGDTVWCSYLFGLSALFRYGRGSARLVAMCQNSTFAIAKLTGLVVNGNTSFWTDDSTDFFYGTNSLYAIADGAHVFRNLLTEPADITIPYYSYTKCAHITYGAKNDTLYDALVNAGSLNIRVAIPANTPKDTVVDRVLYFVGAGDDYQLGYQLPVPRCRFAK